MEGKVLSDEVSDGNKECVIGNQSKGDSCYEVAKNLTELCLWASVLWKVELGSNEMRYLTEAIAKQC